MLQWRVPENTGRCLYQIDDDFESRRAHWLSRVKGSSKLASSRINDVFGGSGTKMIHHILIASYFILRDKLIAYFKKQIEVFIRTKSLVKIKQPEKL